MTARKKKDQLEDFDISVACNTGGKNRNWVLKISEKKMYKVYIIWNINTTASALKQSIISPSTTTLCSFSSYFMISPTFLSLISPLTSPFSLNVSAPPWPHFIPAQCKHLNYSIAPESVLKSTLSSSLKRMEKASGPWHYYRAGVSIISHLWTIQMNTS